VAAVASLVPPDLLGGSAPALSPAPGSSGPLAFHPHPWAWAAVAALAVAYAWALRSMGQGQATTARHKACFGAGLAALAAATTWPLADLGRRWSLLAHMGQMSLILLAAAPLLVLGTPRWLARRLTEPPRVDSLLRRLTTPGAAVVVFNATVVASLLPPVLRAGADSPAAAGAVLAGLLAAGVVMWVPALRAMPGPRQLSTAGRMGYLFLQSVLPNFPALVFILAGRPIYPPSTLDPTALGLEPLTDQRLAGAVAKLVGIAVLWGAAGVILARAHRAEATGQDPDPLQWDDVERELRRLERRRTDAP